MSRPLARGTPRVAQRWIAGLALLCAVAVFALLRFDAASDEAGSGGAREDVRPLGVGAEPAGLQPTSSDRSAGSLAESPLDTTRNVLSGSVVSEELEEGTRVRGVVLDRTTRAPIDQALISLRAEDSGFEATALSDALGNFELAWNAAGSTLLEVHRAGYAPLRRACATLDAELSLELEACARLIGRLHGPSAEGLASAELRLWFQRGSGPARRQALVAQPDSAGNFAFEQLEPGEYNLAATAPGHALAFENRFTLASGEERELSVELARGAHLRGRLYARGTTEGVRAARIEIRPERQGLRSEVEEAAEVSAQTAGDGSFDIAGLSLGRNRIRFQTHWGGELEAELEVLSAGERVERDFHIDRPASLAGRVVDADGRAVSGAWVFVRWGERRLDFDYESPDKKEERLRHLHARTDESGEFRFDQAPARVSLQVLAADERVSSNASTVAGSELRLRAGEERTGLELELQRTLVQTGRVTDREGSPLAGVDVRCYAQVGERRVLCARTRSEATGAFRLGGMTAGPYVLQLEHDGYYAHEEGIEVGEGSYADIGIELAGRPIVYGVVVDEFGGAVSWARVNANTVEILEVDGRKRRKSKAMRRGTWADGYGRFRLEDLVPGRWKIDARASGYAVAAAELTLASVGDEELVLVLRRSLYADRAVLRGLAVLPGGRTPRSLRFDGTRGGAVDVNGSRFRISGVAPGRIKVVCRAAGCESVSIGPFELAPGARLDLGLIELHPVTKFTVRLREGESKPVRRAKVRLLPIPVSEGGAGEGARGYRLKEGKDGGYVTGAARVGKWLLRVDRKGYQPHARRVSVRPGAPETLVQLVRRTKKQR